MKILDLIDRQLSDIGYDRSWFPDGQPHFKLTDRSQITAGDSIDVLCRLRSPVDIVDLGLACDVLQRCGPGRVSVHVAYMLGARMDRPIDTAQPFTLGVMAELLLAACHGVDAITVLDPHSAVTLEQLRIATALNPDRLVKLALDHFATAATIVIPDAGAGPRTTGIVERLGLNNQLARCTKLRDPNTGSLSGFALFEGDVSGRDCLIVDDLCDGGGTFAGISAVLRERGAKRVGLCVTHGVFSKGLPLPGIDAVYSTDSYSEFDSGWLKERGVFGAAHWVTYRRHGHVHPDLYELGNFLRDEVQSVTRSGIESATECCEAPDLGED